MSIEEDNMALVRRYIDLFNRNDLPVEEVIAPLASSFVYHQPGMPDVWPDRREPSSRDV
jgi:hypothetical protein